MSSPSSTRALAGALLRGALAGRAADLGPRLVQLGGSAAAPLRDGLTVGRSPQAGLRLRAPDVSREHARVLAGDEGFVLEDRSKNGLRVNGRRVRGRVRIGPGDLVEVGAARLRVVDGDEPHRPDPLPRSGERTLEARPRPRLRPLLAAGLLLAAAALALAL